MTLNAGHYAVNNGKPLISTFRCVLPQVLACMAMNLLMLGLGLSLGFPTVAIPAFRGLQPEKYPDEVIQLTAVQSSWFGSIIFLTEPLGSIFSGWVTEQIGRKRSMFLAVVPPLTAWTIMYFAQSTVPVFIASILLGFGAGLQGAPIYTYCGEITQPSVRGVLLTITSMCTVIGMCAMFFLGSITTWRNAALVALAFPMLTVIVLTLIPESPQWLIAQNRPDEALKSLRWLRGWAPAENVTAELESVANFIAHANACETCQRDSNNASGVKCTHRSGYFKKVQDLFRTKTLRPFGLILFCMCVIQSSGNAAIRPFLVQIFETFRIPMDANWGSALLGLVDILANLSCVFAIPIVGKRLVMLVGLTGVVVCCFGVAANAYFYLSFDTTSFEKHAHSGAEGDSNPYAFALFVCLGICARISGCVPWMMNSEVYPFRIRGTASGLTSGFAFVTVFLATKTYINFEHTLSICGSFILYGSLSLFGLIVLFNILPDTEGHTLEEIEQFFSDKTRKLTDRRIQPLRNAQAAPSLDNPAFEKSEV